LRQTDRTPTGQETGGRRYDDQTAEWTIPSRGGMTEQGPLDPLFLLSCLSKRYCASFRLLSNVFCWDYITGVHLLSTHDLTPLKHSGSRHALGWALW